MSASTRLPYLPLFGGDFLATTQGWSLEEQGAFLRLLIAQWEMQFLPADLTRVARIIGADADTFARVWPTVRSQFTETEMRGVGPELFNPALADQRAKSQKLAETNQRRARHAANSLWEQRRVVPLHREGQHD